MSKYLIDSSDCLDSAARNLNDLLDVICSVQFEGGDEVDRRVDSLLWIARDLSQGIVDRMAEDANTQENAKGTEA